MFYSEIHGMDSFKVTFGLSKYRYIVAIIDIVVRMLDGYRPVY